MTGITVQSELRAIRQELVDLKRSQVTIAKAIVDQVTDNQFSTERLLNVLNTNMVTIFNAVSSIANEDSKAKEVTAEALNQQWKILQHAQQINIEMREANEPQTLQRFERGVQQEIEEKSAAFLNTDMLEQQLMARSASHLVRDGVLLNTPQNFQRKLDALERQRQYDVLNRGLRNRPDRQSLLEQQVLRSQYDQARNDLERAQRSDALNRSLQNRPGLNELVGQRVLPDANNPILAASLQAQRLKQQQRLLDMQLQNRPDSNQLLQQGIMYNTSSNFNDQSRALSRSQMTDSLNRGLRNRPAVNRLVNQNVLPDAENAALAAHINQQKRLLARQDLEAQLLNRAAIDQLIEEGHLMNTTDNYALMSQQLQAAKNRDFLNRSLVSRPNVDQLVQRRVLPDSQNPVLAAQIQRVKKQQQANLLDSALQQRLTAQELVAQGITYNSTDNYNTQRAALEKSKQVDALQRGLRNRPTADALVKQGVLPDAQNAIVAANLNAQKMKIQANALAAQLQNRPETEEMIRRGHLMNTSTNFDDVSAQLAQQKMKDQLNRSLKNRPDLNTLVDQRVLPDSENPILAAQIQAHRLRQQRALLGDKLGNRKAAQDLVDSGYLINTSANYMTATSALEKSQIADAISRGIRNRPGTEELKEQQILADSNVYSTLQANALALEQEFQANRLNRQLRQRQEAQDLVDAGYLMNTTENWERQRRLLARQQVRDEVNRSLRNRPTANLLHLRNEIAANEVNSQNMGKYVTLLNSYRTVMDQARLDLLSAQRADTVHQQLRNRPAAEELAAKGIYKTTMDQARTDLSVRQTADAVNQQLKNRPTNEELANAGIYKTTMDQAREDLAVSQLADAVNKQLKNRPAAAELANAGIYKTTMDQAREDLAVSQLADAVNQQLKNRPGANELSQVGIYKTTMDQAREDLQNAQLADDVNQLLQQQPEIDELKKRQIYRTLSEDEQYQNENEILKDNMNQLIANIKPVEVDANGNTVVVDDENSNDNSNSNVNANTAQQN